MLDVSRILTKLCQLKNVFKVGIEPKWLKCLQPISWYMNSAPNLVPDSSFLLTKILGSRVPATHLGDSASDRHGPIVHLGGQEMYLKYTDPQYSCGSARLSSGLLASVYLALAVAGSGMKAFGE